MTIDQDWRAYQLEWRVYAEYRLDKGPSDKWPAHIGGFGTGQSPLFKRGNLVIWRTSDGLVTPQPDLFKASGVLRCFAECKTTDDALNFVKVWGFLHSCDADYEHVSDILSAARLAQALLKGADKQNWSKLAAALARHPGSIATLGVQLSTGPAAHPRLWLRPANLFQGMQVQFLDELCRAAQLKRCGLPTCRKFFEYGPGTKHRETAHYCSISCKGKHVYMKRTQKLREARS